MLFRSAIALSTSNNTNNNTNNLSVGNNNFTQVTTTTTNDTLQVVATNTAGGSLAITNAGIFDASTSGNLFAKGDFSTINLNSGDSIQFTFKVQFS